jgi:hypothetical protein
MPFRVEDFHDLIRLLEAQPEWRAELRRLLLTDALLALPERFAELRVDTDRCFQELIAAQQRTEAQVAGLVAAQQRTEAQVASLAAAQQHMETQLVALTTAQQHTETQVARLATAQQHMETQLVALTRVVQTLTNDVGELKGDNLERRYRERAVAYFSRLLRRVRVLSPEELSALLGEAVARGVLSEAEADAVTWTDLVGQGQCREDGAEVTLVVEVSWGVGPYNVERAAERAALLTRAGLTVLPVVAGRMITAEAIALAQRRQVWQVLDGQTVSPSPTVETS